MASRKLDAVLNILTLCLLVLVAYMLVRPGSGPAGRWYAAKKAERVQARMLAADWDSSLTRSGHLLFADESAQGAGSPKVDLVVFSDYQCPYCRQLARTLEEMDSTGDAPTVRWRHWALGNHPSARVAAIGAICAEEVGEFRRMHGYLLSTEEWYPGPTVELIRKNAGIVDSVGFDACIK